jgi:hypothetical protein
VSEQFQVVAATTGRDRAIVLRLAEEIGQALGVDLSGLVDDLSDTGVSVAAADSLVEARKLGAQLLAIGADFVILDEDGEERDAQNSSPPRIESSKPEVGSKTMMGGFNAPELIEMAKAKAAAEKLELDDGGGFAAQDATIGEGAVSIGNAPSGKLELEEDGGFAAQNATIGEGAVSMGKAPSGKLELEEDGGFAAKNATIGEGAVSVGNAPSGKLELEEDGGYAAPDSLVAYGAVGLGEATKQDEGEIELDGPGGYADTTSTIGDGAVDVGVTEEKLELSGPGGFAAPASTKDGFDLDSLDADALVMLDGSSDSLGMSAAPTEAAPPPSGADSSAPAPAVDEASFLPPGAGELETEQALELEQPSLPEPEPEPSSEEDSDAVVDDEGELEWAPAEKQAAASDAPGPSAIPTGDNEAVERPPRRRSAARSDPFSFPPGARPSGPVLLGGKLRTWPRARVAVGFVLCIGLSSVLPMCHANSVRNERIGPLLLELSTAKAHGAIMVSTAGYQPPEQIESTINSIKRRYSIYMMLLWSALAALLLFLWFRFT